MNRSSQLLVRRHVQQLFTFGENDHLLQALLAESVRFLVVGGLAVKFYAAEREADDLDLLLEQSPENATRLFRAFAKMGITPAFPQEAIAAPSERPQHLPMKSALHYADLITLPDIDFEAEWANSQEALVWQNRVRFASRDLLLKLKRGSAREKDIADVALLGDA